MVRTLILLLLGSVSIALAAPEITRPVNDPNDYIDAIEFVDIELAIEEHRKKTGVQIAVLVVDTTHGVPIEDFSMQVARQWGGGSAERDDGLLFTLAIKDRRMRIEVGYGLEPAVSDALAIQITGSIKPKLKAKAYGAAVAQVVEKLRHATAHLDPTQVAAGLPRPARPQYLHSQTNLLIMFLALLFVFTGTRWGKTWVKQAAVAAFVCAGTAVFLGPTGPGWAGVMFIQLIIARILLQWLMPERLGLPKPEAPKLGSFAASPSLYRGCLLFFWFLWPVISWEDPVLDGAYPETGYAFIGACYVWVGTIASVVVVGSLLHFVRLIFSGSSSGSGSYSGGYSGSTYSSSSSWSSSSSSSSDWGSSSSFDSDWGGGGGDFGGGGASDSW
jgi:uncharacterized protein